jgi:hypothetical protein
MSASAKLVDFSNVKDGGNFNKSRIPSGDYLAKITKVEDSKSKKSQEFMYEFTIQLVKKPSSKFPFYCVLTDNQLWKLRNLLIAGGLNVPKAKQKVDVNRLVGRTIGVTVEDTEYDNDGVVKEQSEITGVFPAAELTDSVVDDDNDEAEDEEAGDDDDLDDDLDAPEAEEVEEEPEEEEPEAEEEAAEGDEWDAITDRLELRKALKKVSPDVATKASMSEDDIRDLIRAGVAASAPKVAPKPAAKKTAAKKSTKNVSDEELEELDLDDL